MSASHSRNPRKRIWVQHVAVEADRLQTQLEGAMAGPLSDQQLVIAEGVSKLVDAARKAALKEDPVPGLFTNWWRGTLVEAAYQNLHAARAQIVDLYSHDELQAEIPQAVARAQKTLHRDDLRRTAADQILQATDQPLKRIRPILSRLIADSYEKSDREHAQLRSFRNIVLIAAVSMLVLVLSTVAVIARWPEWMPLCFPGAQNIQVCATSTGTIGPRAADIIMVALLGALGGALTASLSIRNLTGTSTPYDVPVALAMLKVPLGAFTAILALVAIRGGFVPGLSNLDSQEQILAYALVFGFAQQALSRLLDQRAQALMEGLPGGTATEPAPSTSTQPAAPLEPVSPEEAPVPEAAAGQVVAEVTPAGELPEDDEVITEPVPVDAVQVTVDGEPAPTPEQDVTVELLPDEQSVEYFDDGMAEEPEGPEEADGVEYPTAEEEVKG